MQLSQLGLLTFCSSASSFTLINNNNNVKGPTSDSILSSTLTRTYHTSLSVNDRGWDNDNFLNALGGGQDSIENANDKYAKESDLRSTMRERSFQTMQDNGFNFNQGGGGGAGGGSADDDDFANTMLENLTRDVEEEGTAPAAPNSALNEDNSAGGARFRKMMDQAQQRDGPMRQQQPPPPQQQPYQQQQQEQYQPPPPQMQPPVTPPPTIQPPATQQPQQQAQMDPQGYYQALQAWQQAMVAFQQFTATNPEVAAQMTPPAPPPPPPSFAQPEAQPQAVPQQPYQTPAVTPESQPLSATTASNDDDKEKDARDYLPKKAGGNTDAYDVNNSADVYFAQLKRDSAVRIKARKAGDLEAANAPFAEKGVQALSGLLSDELMATRRERLAQNGGEFETSRDEMILPSHFAGEGDVDKTSTGVSYRERLMKAKKRRDQN